VIATRDAPLTCERRPIGVDLEEDCAPALLHGGFDPDAPTAWIVEGFTPYLDPAQVDRLLERIGSLAAPGSRLAMDMLDLRFFEQPWSQRDLALVRERGVPWRFGTDDPAGLLERHGWCAEITRPGQPGADFGRWPHPDALVYLVVADRR
jgi:methyltransferase (TIGR00027 family)